MAGYVFGCSRTTLSEFLFLSKRARLLLWTVRNAAVFLWLLWLEFSKYQCLIDLKMLDKVKQSLYSLGQALRVLAV
jgi:hypothetical protein